MRMLTVRLRTLIEDVLGEIGEVLSELTSFGVRECLFMPLHRERAIYVHSFDLHGSMSNTDQYGSWNCHQQTYRHVHELKKIFSAS